MHSGGMADESMQGQDRRDLNEIETTRSQANEHESRNCSDTSRARMAGAAALPNTWHVSLAWARVRSATGPGHKSRSQNILQFRRKRLHAIEGHRVTH